jgi:N utilization substance protein B
MIINRRHLRIKVIQALYAYFQDDNPDFVKHEKELLKNINKMYDLYILLLQAVVEVKLLAERKIEDAHSKRQPTEEDLNPNRKFIDNQLINAIEDMPELRRELQNRKVNWDSDVKQEIIRKIYVNGKNSESYTLFMNNEMTGFEEDKAFLTAYFKENIANSAPLLFYFDEENIHWSDDIDLMCSMVLKTIKSIKPESHNTILPFYDHDSEEMQLVRGLFAKTVNQHAENQKLIEGLADNWELDRIAKMDVLLMSMSITEMQGFPTIPLNVSLNEYIEISKFYSTPKSNTFINGILDKAIAELKKDGKLNKEGRGLINTKI